MKHVDRPLLITAAILVIVGFFIFSSASLGLLARQGASFSSVAFSQLVLGIVGGAIGAFLISRVHYRKLRKYALYIFIAAIAVSLLVFIPGLGVELYGAQRWITIGPLSFQPAELLKLGFVVYFAAWLSGVHNKIHSFGYGPLPFFILLGIVGAILLAQPDTGTFAVLFAAGIAMYIVAGARIRDLALIGAAAASGLVVLALSRTYILERLQAFINPAQDPLGSSYQIQQSLIAIGSGEWVGRGFGQSVQKFSHLPGPIDDSIFAVAAEEFGFIGATLLIALFLVFALRGLKIAAHAPDRFSGLLAVGIVILIIGQSFLNIGAMLGVLPLTGLPLLFVSHGGSAMLFVLLEVGILLNISKYAKLTPK